MPRLIADLIPPLNSDYGICDAARVSFRKEASGYTMQENKKLLRYLHGHAHWSPYAHARETFGIGIDDADLLHVLLSYNPAGFTHARSAFGHDIVFNGSLWAWYQNLKYFPTPIQRSVRRVLEVKYPLAFPILFPDGAEIVEAADILEEVGYAEHLELPEGAGLEYPQLVYLTFRMAVPIFLARQAVKHQIQLTWNEVSRRYVTDDVELWTPDNNLWRGAPEKSIKQGSTDTLVAYSQQEEWDMDQNAALLHYDRMLKEGIAPEDARIGLPLNMMTEWIWTGSLLSWRRVCKDRLGPGAQKYIRDWAESVFKQLSNAYPQEWLLLWNKAE